MYVQPYRELHTLGHVTFDTLYYKSPYVALMQLQAQLTYVTCPFFTWSLHLLFHCWKKPLKSCWCWSCHYSQCLWSEENVQPSWGKIKVISKRKTIAEVTIKSWQGSLQSSSSVVTGRSVKEPCKFTISCIMSLNHKPMKYWSSTPTSIHYEHTT